MKLILKSLPLLFLLINLSLYAQEIQTLSVRGTGFYGAKVNKFTVIDNNYAHLAGLYGGWYVNHKFMIGVEVAALTNHIPVPTQYSAYPGTKMNYGYGQFGLMTEYVPASSKAIHVAYQLFSGAGFTTQYERNHHHDEYKNAKDTNWFFVAEPGVNIEFNIFKWMRFCPGLSYRTVFGSNGASLKNKDINGMSFNLGLKIGKF